MVTARQFTAALGNTVKATLLIYKSYLISWLCPSPDTLLILSSWTRHRIPDGMIKIARAHRLSPKCFTSFICFALHVSLTTGKHYKVKMRFRRATLYLCKKSSRSLVKVAERSTVCLPAGLARSDTSVPISHRSRAQRLEVWVDYEVVYYLWEVCVLWCWRDRL